MHRLLRIRHWALVAGLGLAGCAGHAEGVMAPQARCAAPANCIDMIVVTNRLRDHNRAKLYNGERAPGVELTEIEISIPPKGARKIGEINWPQQLPGNPATDFVTTNVVADMTRPAAEARFAALAAKHKGRVLVFVHGYNTKFEEAVYRFAQFANDTGDVAAPILFTWPSRGRLLDYGYDRESANFSRDMLEEGLQALQRNASVREITLVAHSMGNWVAVEALRQMAIRNKRLVPKLKNVVLAAPDLDTDVFRKQMAEIPQPHPTITVLISRDDRALGFSTKVWGAGTRLGALGADPRDEAVKAELIKEGIRPIDITGVEATDPARHGRFAESPEIVQAIGVGMIEGDRSMGTGQAGVGDRLGTIVTGVTGAVGNTAAAIVTAPAAIVDANSREGFGDRIQSVGGSLSSVATGTP